MFLLGSCPPPMNKEFQGDYTEHVTDIWNSSRILLTYYGNRKCLGVCKWTNNTHTPIKGLWEVTDLSGNRLGLDTKHMAKFGTTYWVYGDSSPSIIYLLTVKDDFSNVGGRVTLTSNITDGDQFYISAY